MSRLTSGIDPGRLFDRVDIEAEVAVPDNEGGFLPGPLWLAVFSDLPAEVVDLSGGERIRAMQTEAHVTARVTLRYVEGIEAGMRVNVTSQGNRVLLLEEPPIRVGRTQQLTLLCREEL
jgi:SPP1 family predicted phage head-tail adaptor